MQTGAIGLAGKVSCDEVSLTSGFYLNHFDINWGFSQANSEDLDETPHYAASHPSLHCLPMSHL